MKLWLLNQSTDARLTPSLMTSYCEALSEQLLDHFGPAWEQEFEDVDELSSKTARNALARRRTLLESSNSPDLAVITLFDTADQAGELGDHELVKGIPSGRVFVKTILDAGGDLETGNLSVPAVLSHEACEIGGDPYANWWAEYPSTGNRGSDLVALEAADPVEDESYQATNGLSLSNFVTPRWFRDGKGPFDYMRTRKAPFEVSDGGYIILREKGPVFGPQSKETRRAFKAPRRAQSAKLMVGGTSAVPPALLGAAPVTGKFRTVFMGGRYRRIPVP